MNRQRVAATSFPVSRARLDAVRRLTSAAMGRLSDGHVNRALALLEEGLARVDGLEAVYGTDEIALDSLLAALAVAAQIAQEPQYVAELVHARDLLSRALAARVAALRGEVAA